MLKKNVVKGLLGVSAVVALFGALAAQAQTSQGAGASTAGTTGQQGTGSSGTSGQSGSSGASGTSGQKSGASGASGTSGQSGSGGTSATATGGATTGAAAGAALSRADQKIITDMAQANMAEIETGKLAQSKSQNDQVKNFAQQMIDDHTKALTELQQLAQAKGATLPTDLDMKHKAMSAKLAAMSGDSFDKAYMSQAGVADHKRTHSMLQQNQARAKDPELKALAAKLLPTVDQHLNAANQLQGTKGAKQSTTGTASSGKTTQ
jgi:putative membrane protein